MEGLRSDSSMSREDRRAKMKQIHENTRSDAAQIELLLMDGDGTRNFPRG